MKILCFLCKSEIEIKSTKRGLPYGYCQLCQTRMFASSPQAIEALNELTIDGEPFEPQAQVAEPSPPVIGGEGSKIDWDAPSDPKQEGSSQDGTVVFEVKSLKKRVDVLEAQVSAGPSPAGNPDKEKVACPKCDKKHLKADLLNQELEGGILREKGYYCECGRLLLDEKGEPVLEDRSSIDWDA